MSAAMMESRATSQAATPAGAESGRVARLRALAFAGLRRMYRPSQHDFVFTLRRTRSGVQAEGESIRYTAITLLGLARESGADARGVLGGESADRVGARLVERLDRVTNLGDVALTFRAAVALTVPTLGVALARMQALFDSATHFQTVELAWVVSALCEAPETAATRALRERAARLLCGVFEQSSGLFPHTLSKDGSRTGRHVACFADLVYPIEALAELHTATGSSAALHMATRCAEQICELMGAAGQWWWHYDVRTGRVLERYPVYSVHQHAMAPLALHALHAAGGPDMGRYIRRGLDWQFSSPELDGGTLIDDGEGLIWRKVARREPKKLVRKAQAFMSRVHSRLRVPAVNLLFPPGTIDAEVRPYELGWLLYAWPAERAAKWDATERGSAR